MRKKIASFLCLTVAGNFYCSAQAQPAPVDSPNSPTTLYSPDHRYGVTIPRADQDGNNLIDAKTGRPLAAIEGATGYLEGGGWDKALTPRWSKDDSFLLWSVDGKWCPSSITLIKVENGAVKWQRDLLTVGQEAILAQVRKVRPKQYEDEKKRNEGSGSAYPDGFTVDVAMEGKPDSPMTFPLVVHVWLTSDPKRMEGHEAARIDAQLNGTVDKDGQFKITEFHFGTKPPAPRWG